VVGFQNLTIPTLQVELGDVSRGSRIFDTHEPLLRLPFLPANFPLSRTEDSSEEGRREGNDARRVSVRKASFGLMERLTKGMATNSN